MIKGKHIILCGIACILADLAIIISCYRSLPALVPAHFNGNMQPDGYSSKSFLFLLWGIHCFIVTLLSAVFFIIKKYRPQLIAVIFIIVIAQGLLAITDTLNTILSGIRPSEKSVLSYIDYIIVFITVVSIGAGYLYQRKKNRRQSY